jgi:PAS domain S-box-containing protein
LKGRDLADHGDARATPHDIMVVDDNPIILKLLQKVLEHQGYTVRTADSGAEALKSIASLLPDLILLDIKMPEMDGFEVCRRLKATETTREIPIIYLSAMDETEHKIEGFKAGGVDYITKPFQSEEVLSRVKIHLKIRDLAEHLEQKVAERTAELTQANKNLRQEIRHRRNTERALQQARDNLERMVEARTVELSIKNRQLTTEIEKHHETEQALRASEINYRTIFETTASATMIIEKNGTLSLVNTEFERLTGYTKAQVEGRKKWLEFVFQDDLEMVENYRRLRCKDPDAAPLNYECRIQGKKGQIRNIFLTVGMMPGTNQSVVSFLDVSKLKQIEQTLRDSERRLHYLSSRLLAAQENERQRISMEIHDELGQNLAVLKLELTTLAGRLRKDQSALKKDCNHILEFIDGIIEEMRRISRDLSPSIIQDLKLCRSLEWMLHDFSKHSEICVSHKIADINTMFNSKGQILIYRIFQEALNNIRKHAHAQHVSVAMKKKDGYLSISIKDDGKGFNITDLWQRHVAERGLGIASLEERTRMLGGKFDLNSAPGRGTCLTITIPLAADRGDS